jgi:hypothetical protein
MPSKENASMHSLPMSPSRLLFSCSVALLAGCSASTSGGGATTNDSDFTTERAAPTGEVTPFSEVDAPTAYMARVRVSFAGAATQELMATPATLAVSKAPRFSIGVGQSPAKLPVLLYFGAAGDNAPAVGTYSCADGDAKIFEAGWNGDGTAKPARVAATCSVVIDAIGAGPSVSYSRAYGRFEATAAVPDGLSVEVKGAFVADFPLGE